MDRTAYKNRNSSKNRNSKENEVDLMMIYESLKLSIWDCPFFWNLATSQLVTSQKPQTNELLQRKATQTNKGDTKHNQTTTILFFTLLLTYGFLETIQIQTQEENIE